MKKRLIIDAMIVGALSWGLAALGDDWPQWRGPNRERKSAKTDSLNAWPKDGPRPLWKVRDFADVCSGTAIVGGRLYAQGQAFEEQQL